MYSYHDLNNILRKDPQWLSSRRLGAHQYKTVEVSQQATSNYRRSIVVPTDSSSAQSGATLPVVSEHIMILCRASSGHGPEMALLEAIVLWKENAWALSHLPCAEASSIREKWSSMIADVLAMHPQPSGSPAELTPTSGLEAPAGVPTAKPALKVRDPGFQCVWCLVSVWCLMFSFGIGCCCCCVWCHISGSGLPPSKVDAHAFLAMKYFCVACDQKNIWLQLAPIFFFFYSQIQ